MSATADMPASISTPHAAPMSEAVAHVAPFHDPSRKRRLVKVAGWIVGTAVVVFVLDLLGVDVIGWLQDLWDQIKAVPVGYIVAALVFQTGQTLLAGLSYYGILRAAYPGEAGRVLADRDRLRGRRRDEQLPARRTSARS